MGIPMFPDPPIPCEGVASQTTLEYGRMSGGVAQELRTSFNKLVATQVWPRLSKMECERLRYFYKDLPAVSATVSESDDSTLSQFHTLEKARVFSYDHPEHLAEVMEELGREDIRKEVQTFIERHKTIITQLQEEGDLLSQDGPYRATQVRQPDTDEDPYCRFFSPSQLGLLPESTTDPRDILRSPTSSSDSSGSPPSSLSIASGDILRSHVMEPEPLYENPALLLESKPPLLEQKMRLIAKPLLGMVKNKSFQLLTSGVMKHTLSKSRFELRFNPQGQDGHSISGEVYLLEGSRLRNDVFLQAELTMSQPRIKKGKHSVSRHIFHSTVLMDLPSRNHRLASSLVARFPSIINHINLVKIVRGPYLEIQFVIREHPENLLLMIEEQAEESFVGKPQNVQFRCMLKKHRQQRVNEFQRQLQKKEEQVNEFQRQLQKKEEQVNEFQRQLQKKEEQVNEFQQQLQKKEEQSDLAGKKPLEEGKVEESKTDSQNLKPVGRSKMLSKMLSLFLIAFLAVYVLLSGGLGWIFSYLQPPGVQTYPPYQTQVQVAELTAITRYMETLKFTLFNSTYPEIAYLAFQAEIINETALENILVHSEGNRNAVQRTFEAIQYGISQNPTVFHKFVYLLLHVDKEVMEEMADELQAEYVHEIRSLLTGRTQFILSDTVDYNGKHIDQWEEYGIKLDIPKGAIPQGKNVTFVVSCIASKFLQVPEGYEVVSPVYRILPSFQFSKQIAVRIEHWALIDSEDSISRMAFVHDSKGVRIVRGIFQKQSSWGVLKTSTLCSIYVCRLSGIFMVPLLHLPILGSLLQMPEEKAYQAETAYQVDMCIRKSTKANEWISYVCMIAWEHKVDSCMWLQRDRLRGEGWNYLRQTRKKFQFAPNCDYLELDEEASISTAREQGYELYFESMTNVQRSVLEEEKTPLCQTIRLTPNENPSTCMQLKCPLPLKCTCDYNTNHQCNLTLKTPASSCGTGQKIVDTPGMYAQVFDQRPKMNELHLLIWEEEGQRKTRNIISEVAYRWKSLGCSFGFEESVLSSIEVEEQKDQEECCYAVIQKWRESGSEREEYPVTWQGFIRVLKDGKFQTLADELQIILPKKKH